MDAEDQPIGGGPFSEVAHIPDAHARAVCSVRWSPDGAAIASASADGTAKLWSPAGAPLCTLEGHSQGVNDAAWSPDGAILASCSDDATIRIWDVATVRALQASAPCEPAPSRSLTPTPTPPHPRAHPAPPAARPAGHGRLQAPPRPRQLCGVPRLLPAHQPAGLGLL